MDNLNDDQNTDSRVSSGIFFFFSLNGPRRSYSSSPESAAGQVLTLADLTPAGSEPNLSSKGRRGTPLIGSSQPLRSSYPDLRNGSTHLSPREQEVRVHYAPTTVAVMQCKGRGLVWTDMRHQNPLP